MISKDPENQPFEQKLVCGSFSGLCVATVLTPVELIKCKMQTNNEAAVVYKNSMQCVAAIIRCVCVALACHARGQVQPCARSRHARTIRRAHTAPDCAACLPLAIGTSLLSALREGGLRALYSGHVGTLCRVC